MRTIKKYSAEEQSLIVKKIIKDIKDNFKVDSVDSLDVYEVEIQDQKFRCAYTEDEINSVSLLVCEMVEKMKERIDDGIDQDRLDQEWNDYEKDENLGEVKKYIKILYFVKTIMNEEMWVLFAKIAGTMRVGGAYFMLMAGPSFQSAIYSCYDVFLRYINEDETLRDIEPETYVPYFLMRAAMQMHSKEIND